MCPYLTRPLSLGGNDMLRRPSRGPEVSLRSLALFSRCSDRELRRVARIATEVEVEAGRLLTFVGRPDDQFFVIVSGIASVWREGVRLDVLQRGSFFGEGRSSGPRPVQRHRRRRYEDATDGNVTPGIHQPALPHAVRARTDGQRTQPSAASCRNRFGGRTTVSRAGHDLRSSLSSPRFLMAGVGSLPKQTPSPAACQSDCRPTRHLVTQESTTCHSAHS